MAQGREDPGHQGPGRRAPGLPGGRSGADPGTQAPQGAGREALRPHVPGYRGGREAVPGFRGGTGGAGELSQAHRPAAKAGQAAGRGQRKRVSGRDAALHPAARAALRGRSGRAGDDLSQPLRHAHRLSEREGAGAAAGHCGRLFAPQPGHSDPLRRFPLLGYGRAGVFRPAEPGLCAFSPAPARKSGRRSSLRRGAEGQLLPLPGGIRLSQPAHRRFEKRRDSGAL